MTRFVPDTVAELPSRRRLKWTLIAILVLSAAAIGGLYYAHLQGRLLEGFYVLLIACFAAGLLATLRGFGVLSREGAAQSELVAELNDIDLLEGVERHEEGSLMLRVLRSLALQWKRGGRKAVTLDADPFLDTMLNRLSRPARLVEGCGATCQSIGHLGTLAGISEVLERLSISAADGALSASADTGGFEAMFGAGGPAVGLAVAFLTSLVGGVMKLVLSKLAAALRAHARALTDHTKDFVGRDFAPALLGKEDED